MVSDCGRPASAQLDALWQCAFCAEKGSAFIFKFTPPLFLPKVSIEKQAFFGELTFTAG